MRLFSYNRDRATTWLAGYMLFLVSFLCFSVMVYSSGRTAYDYYCLRSRGVATNARILHGYPEWPGSSDGAWDWPIEYHYQVLTSAGWRSFTHKANICLPAKKGDSIPIRYIATRPEISAPLERIMISRFTLCVQHLGMGLIYLVYLFCVLIVLTMPWKIWRIWMCRH